jgi:type II secretory pathway pseudopilin PulG
MRAHHPFQGGFTYIGLLVAVVIMGIMLTAASKVWTITGQREREIQLLWAGHAIRMAIASYYASGHQFPASLQDLVQDDRWPVPKHHLRRLYVDPMTGSADWTLVPAPSDGRIMGVASSSKGVPMKRAGFDAIDAALQDSDCYCAWQFVYYPNQFNRKVTPATVTPAPFSPGTVRAAPVTQGAVRSLPGSN